jgi:2-oxoglutarate ferredoxin oxidoreductase subunit beta
MKLTRKDFQSEQEVRWCPGCGDYSILAQVQKTLADSGVAREEAVFVSGIGCSSRFPYYMNTYGFHTIHGRAPAIATGLKAVRPDLQVWVVTGDGDALSIGGNHFVHALRRNVDIKILLFNNRIYGLTKGQYSPTSQAGTKSKSTPYGSVDRPFEPVQLAIAAGATFVARSIDVEANHLGGVLRRMAAHRGAAFVEILQNCVVFNDGAFAQLTDKETKDDAQLRVEHGKPLVFGRAKDRAVALRGGATEVVTAAADGTPWDEHAPASVAFTLAGLRSPTPIGVFRSIEETPHHELERRQREEVRKVRGDGNLEELLRSGDTWRVAP